MRVIRGYGLNQRGAINSEACSLIPTIELRRKATAAISIPTSGRIYKVPVECKCTTNLSVSL